MPPCSGVCSPLSFSSFLPRINSSIKHTTTPSPPFPIIHTNRLRAWYPVAIVSQLDAARPTPTQLLGRQMVVWFNPKTKL